MKQDVLNRIIIRYIIAASKSGLVHHSHYVDANRKIRIKFINIPL